jgi:hypothetical protein
MYLQIVLIYGELQGLLGWTDQLLFYIICLKKRP